MKLTKGQQISAGGFKISIGNFTITEVAIYHKSQSQGFSKLESTKRSKKLKKVKRVFGSWINNDKEFCFSHFQDDQVEELIKILKN